jgi:photosystem I P700 chlorophyll a apoprotein A2
MYLSTEVWESTRYPKKTELSQPLEHGSEELKEKGKDDRYWCFPFKERPPALAVQKDLDVDPTTRAIWYQIGWAHDLESVVVCDEKGLYNRIFASHFGHLAIILLWTSGNLFHVAWQGNFQQWVLNPLQLSPIAHAIWDPHMGPDISCVFTPDGVSYPATVATSGVYHWWYTIGMRTDLDLYVGSVFLLLVSCLLLLAGVIHMKPKFQPSLSWFKNAESGLNHHLSGLFGLSSLAWSGHLIHVAIPGSRGVSIRWSSILEPPHPAGWRPLLFGEWSVYSEFPDGANHVFGTGEGAGTAILTFLGGFHPQTQSMWLTDIAHHHLCIGVLFILAGHLYRTNWGLGLQLRARGTTELRYGFTHRSSELPVTLSELLCESLHFQLSLALAALGVASSLVAQHMYALPSYVFIAESHVTQASLYVHHQYIAGFLMVGAFAHGAIFLVRDYQPSQESLSHGEGTLIMKMLDNKEAIISHLSWVTLFLGFHTLGIYVHNDVCVAFGTPERQILIEPVFAQFVQASSGKLLYGFDVLLSSPTSPASLADGGVWLPGWTGAINDSTNSLFLDIGPGDFLVHHAISLGVHTSVLILLKGALDSRGSVLMPDKKDFGYSFPCDGPGRGGTCDISAWDAFYLAMFWMLNTTSWVTFYWHWKHLSIWGSSGGFGGSSTYLMGWFRDYLWANSVSVINGYNAYGVSGASVWAWMFLFGHLIWATGFMFLISWRGYWQELVETLVWAHNRTPLASFFLWVDAPVALSIVQGRLVGLAHFTVGYIFTYAPFLIASLGG